MGDTDVGKIFEAIWGKTGDSPSDGEKGEKGVGKIFESIRDALREKGIHLDANCCVDGDEGARVKVVCVAPDLKESVECVAAGSRDQVVMVRVDEATSKALDAWVESGSVKSRSEAAAVFIREGLKLREAELSQLREALDAVEQAKAKLRDRAKEVFGKGG